MFSHEKLDVYEKALQFTGYATEIATAWGSKHAIREHLPRAGESIVENIAQGCATGSLPAKQRSLDVALGSTLECGGCIDIAGLKGLIAVHESRQRKAELVTIANMLVGLRQSWGALLVRESRSGYGNAMTSDEEGFHHERLDMYQLALEVVQWLSAIDHAPGLPTHVYRKLDAETTSIVLNIAEGNGKYSARDHIRFLRISNRASVKLAAQLDICRITGLVDSSQLPAVKEMLFRIGCMTAVLIEKVEE